MNSRLISKLKYVFNNEDEKRNILRKTKLHNLLLTRPQTSPTLNIKKPWHVSKQKKKHSIYCPTYDLKNRIPINHHSQAYQTKRN